MKFKFNDKVRVVSDDENFYAGSLGTVIGYVKANKWYEVKIKGESRIVYEFQDRDLILIKPKKLRKKLV